MKIPIGVPGHVTNSEQLDHFVQVDDDRDNTGGFLIFEWWEGSDGLGENGAFDSWVETREDLRAYFEEAGWQIVWTQREDESS
ncbi:MAG: hypothetical protein AAGI69_22105 [Cyanobacteria bacterium P01_H01_bin.21]